MKNTSFPGQETTTLPACPVVHAPCGPVAGFREHGMEAFLSIPYAESTAGNRRFLPPEPKARWEDPFDASRVGPRAMQNPSQWGPADMDCSEDCLHLSLWTPSADEQRRPVVVQIHGGAHCEGFSIDPFHNGPRFVRQDQIVFVSINYRLGVFGYLDVSRLLGVEYAQSGNNGLLDQIQALRWVRDNISAFGGDPERVILMGQSAGAKSVGALLLAPAAKGLFHGAILQSGAVQCVRDQQTALRVTDLLTSALSIGDPRSLLSLPAEELLRGQRIMEQSYAMFHLYSSTVDGVTLPEEPDNAIEAGRFAHVPVLLGYNRDELLAQAPEATFDEETVARRLHLAFGVNAPHVLQSYRLLSASTSSAQAIGTTITAYVYGNACLHLTRLLAAQGGPVWAYLWEVGLNGLAHHSSEMPYLFGYDRLETEGGYDPSDKDIADSLHAAWISFVLTGSPDTDTLPHWPPCTSGDTGFRMRFSSSPHVEPLDLHAYDTLFPTQAFQL